MRAWAIPVGGTVLVAAAVAARGAVAPPWLWLVYNLGLAWVPLLIGAAASRGRAGLLGLGLPWLLFLPNAPYLLTDLVHLRAYPGVPLWFDVALLGGAGALGLAIGARSVADMAAAVCQEIGPRAALAVTVFAPVASGFGMYLGRFERWNSWSVLTRPDQLLADGLGPLLHPAHHVEAWAFTSVFGGLFLVAALGAPVRRTIPG